MTSPINVHIGGEPTARSLPIPPDATASDLLDLVRAAGVSVGADAVVYVEDGEQPLASADALTAGDGAATAYFLGHRYPVRVTVGYGGERVVRDFSPATRLRTVERWAAEDLDAPTQKPHRLALRYADTVLTPGEDAFLGALDVNNDRDLHFDLHVEEDRDVEVTIVVNGRQRTVAQRTISFAEVVALAFPTPPGPNTIYTVTYRGARGSNPSGTLAEGGSVKIKNQTTFNVTSTDRS